MFEGLASPWHLIIIVFLFLMLFGAKRLPEMARALGQSARILKAETAGGREDADEHPTVATAAVQDTAFTPVVVDDRLASPLPARFDIYTGRPLASAPRSTTTATGQPSAATD